MVFPAGLAHTRILMAQHPENSSWPLPDNARDGTEDDLAVPLPKLPRLTRDQQEAIKANTRRLRELLEQEYLRNSSPK